MLLKELRGLCHWQKNCSLDCVGAASIYELDNELFQRIEEISSLCERVEHAVDALIERHGARSETVAAAQALQASVVALKRELLQHYLECRIADAARPPASQSR